MNKISLAIPFYNTSRYFLDAIKYTIDDDFISEIVVNDDGSSEEELKKLDDIIKNLNTNKIKVFKNEENYGAFRNKYITVDRCTSDWIYLLDSDNIPFETTYPILKTIDQSKPNIIFSPEQLHCRKDGQEVEVISDYNFKYDLIGIEECKDAILKRTKWFDWFTNSGNYFINRNFYLNSLQEPFKNYSSYKLYADTIASFYFMLKNEGLFKVVPNFYHIHRIRPDSYWVTCGAESQATVDLFTSWMLNL
tara:strand:+ start:1681 stop:2427 length:747 start_codon:yes stop_codon:yes gene_type:complete